MWIYAIPLMKARSQQEALRLLREQGAGRPGHPGTVRPIQHSAEHRQQVQRMRGIPARLVRKLWQLVGKCSRSGGSI